MRYMCNTSTSREAVLNAKMIVEEEETLFDPKSANVQCITYQI